MLSGLAGLLRLASLVLCLIAVAAFAQFAIDQTSSASTHQQQLLGAGPPSPATAPGASVPTSHQGTLHRTIAQASEAISSPFSSLTAGSSSQWVIHGADLMLALAVYGFGLGFAARVLRMRV